MLLKSITICCIEISVVLVAMAFTSRDWSVMTLMFATIWGAVNWAYTDVKRVAVAAPKTLLTCILKIDRVSSVGIRKAKILNGLDLGCDDWRVIN